jgi:hypothetical protein
MTHPDSDVLAEFRAGLVTGRRRAAIASHLAACDRCAGLSDQLGELSALLAAGRPAAMPDDVARRLDLVLATEAANRNSSERPVDDSAAHPASSPGPRRSWNFRLITQRILLPAAAVVVLAAGGYGLSRVAGGSSPSQATSGTAAAPAVPAASSAASAVAAPSASTHGLAEPAAGAGSRSVAGPAIEAPATFGVVTSMTDYFRPTLAQQLEDELRRYPRTAERPQLLAAGPVKGCVLRVTAGTSPGTVVLVETARFQGQPAIVIVAVSGHHDQAWVTASGCSASSDHVLATASLPGTSTP